MNAITDTNIHVDIYRGYPPALHWLAANPNLVLGLSSLVRMELVLGCNNKIEQGRILTFLSKYPILYPNEADAKWAMDHFELYHLSHGVEIIDCFIAAMSVRHDVPLLTRNTKHFAPFPVVNAVAPY